jgi:hypothetical protein
MSDEEDFVFDVANAGASATIPMEAGQIKKGGYVDNGTACSVADGPRRKLTAVYVEHFVALLFSFRFFLGFSVTNAGKIKSIASLMHFLLIS